MRDRRILLVGAFGIILIAAFLAVPGCRSLISRAATEDVVRAAIDAGKYVEAERLAVEWSDRLQDTRNTGSLELANALDWLVTARLKNGRAGDQRTLTLGERALALKEQDFGPESLQAAASRFNLGATLLNRGALSGAVDAFERTLRIQKSTLGADAAAVAETLDQLALALIRLERFDEAEQRATESLRIRERSSSRQLELARTLEVLGTLHRYAGRYAAAVGPLDRALSIRRTLAPEHPDIVTAMQIRGDVHLLMGDTAGARHMWSSALDLGERTLRRDHPLVADVLRRLGIAAFSLGQLAEARQLVERARSIGQRSLAPCDPLNVGLAIGVGDSLRYDGEYAEARKLYRDSLATVRRCIDAREADLTADAEATLVFNDAEISREVGDFVEADQLFARAVETWSKGLRPDHPFVAKGLDAQAEVAASRGQLSRAQELYERALDIRRRDLGEQHPSVAWTLTNLSATMADMGDVSRALRYLQQAMDIYRKSGASDEPDHYARVLELKGRLETSQGNRQAARGSLAQALDERTRIFGDSHPLVAESRAALAHADFARGEMGAALHEALDAERSGREHLLFTVRYLPERQALMYAWKRPHGLDLALTVVANGLASNAADVYDAVIRSRGVILDEFAARHRANINTSPEVATLVAAATAARQRFANLVVRSLQEPVSRSLLDEARKQREDAERALAERSVESRTEIARIGAGLDDILRARPTNTALASYVRYERTRPAIGASTAEPSYGVFVVASGSSTVTFVPLGSAARLDRLITDWHKEASGQSIAAGIAPNQVERRYRETSTRLRQALWDPVAPQLTAATRVFVVPDGLVNLVNIAALQDDRGGYLAENESVIHYLTTERDLLLPRVEGGNADTLLAVGGPAFDDVMPASKATPVRRGVECPSLAKAHFESLPGSLGEVDEISALWPKTPGDSVTLLRGAAATESAVKRAAAGRRIVHLATHGFFLGGDCMPGPPGTRAVGGLSTTPSASGSAVSENPLLLTGLALAGANNWSKAAIDQDEGLLTAEEITGLNLQGTAWAVLSACDTGLGEIQAGEGVFGLRRAFQIAGARTVIMSLWSVEDESTREWMRALYEGRLRRKVDTASAVREASLTVLRDRRAKGQSTLPFYWAAFVAAGDWR
jgi:CHAT domain-containing protein/tetratricopeptide (TPR) repeat protein